MFINFSIGVTYEIGRPYRCPSVDQYPSRTSSSRGLPCHRALAACAKASSPLAELLDVEIVIMNAEGYCVGGTGPYLRGVGFRMPADNALTYSLRSGQSSMVLTPGKEEVCRTCSGRGPARMWPISRGRW